MIGRENIVINADDFGKSPRANKNILELIKLDKIQRVSVMVEGKINREEVVELQNSKVRLDIHLEIPRLSSSGDPAHRDGRGKARGSRKNSKFFLDYPVEPGNDKRGKSYIFLRSFRFILFCLTNRINRRIIKRHWEAQIGNFVNIFNKIPDGLNSHEHVHFFPPYFKIALRLCKKYKIPYLRFGRNVTWYVPTNGIAIILNFLRRINKKHFDRNLSSRDVAGYVSKQTKTSDYLVNFDWIKNPDIFLDSLVKPENDKNGSTEIVCHPERREEFEKIRLLDL